MKIRTVYRAVFDELDVISEQIAAGGMSVEEAKRRFRDCLWDAYVEGHAIAVWIMEGEEEEELNGLEARLATFQMYGDRDIYDRLEDHMLDGNADAIRELVVSEGHRVFNAAMYDVGQNHPEYEKVWLTMRDDRVRDTHRYLEGTAAPMDGVFYTYDGDEARYPGDFSDPNNNANCRCVIEYRRTGGSDISQGRL